MPSFLIFTPRNGTEIFCSYSVGKNLVLWPQLIAREAGNCSVAGQSCAQEEGGNKFWWTTGSLCHSPKQGLFLTYIASSKTSGI